LFLLGIPASFSLLRSGRVGFVKKILLGFCSANSCANSPLLFIATNLLCSSRKTVTGNTEVPLVLINSFPCSSTLPL
ncbi:unnamed protein product, partial [Rotaria magnacalcarata]